MRAKSERNDDDDDDSDSGTDGRLKLVTSVNVQWSAMKLKQQVCSFCSSQQQVKCISEQEISLGR